MANVLVVAPHPDDETIGCGGTLLKHIDQGDQVCWLIVTKMDPSQGYSDDQIEIREAEIKSVSEQFGFHNIARLDFPTTQLDTLPLSEVIVKISQVLNDLQPQVIYMPYSGDAHSDHRVVFDAMAATTKSFRQTSIQRILCYETLSETDFSLNPDYNSFRPNVFYNISKYLEKKLAIANKFASEINQFPFPRSEHAIKSLASIRGATANCHAAEAFMLLREINY